MTGSLLPLGKGEPRARRRLAAIVLVYLWEAAFALLVASPMHAWARRAWGAHPDGDRVLWEPGGRELLIWLGQPDGSLAIALRVAMLLLIAGAVASQLPLGALVASLAFARDDEGRAPHAVAAARAGVGAFLPLTGLLALLAIAQGIVLGLGVFASSAIDHRLAERLGDARSFTLRLVVLGIFVLLALALGVFADLARAAIGREAGFAAARGSVHPAWNVMLRGIRVAMTASRGRRGLGGLGAAMGAWGWRALAGVALVGVGYAAAGAFGVGGGGALVLVAVVHQLVVLGRTGLRASWLAHALRMIAPAQDDLLGRNEEPRPSSASK